MSTAVNKLNMTESGKEVPMTAPVIQAPEDEEPGRYALSLIIPSELLEHERGTKDHVQLKSSHFRQLCKRGRVFSHFLF